MYISHIFYLKKV